MSLLNSVKSFLSIPFVYQGFQNAVGKKRLLTAIIGELGPLAPETRVLDIGCGTADILGYLPPVTYLGVDLSARYIEAATGRFHDRGDFRVLRAEGLAELRDQEYDVAMAIGLVHHLSDEQARQMLMQVRRLLGPHGRLLLVDPVFVAGQSRLAAWLMSHDRGRFVRTLSAYRDLSVECFPQWHGTVHHDLHRIPYTHLIQRCHT
jgi:SAM-dependent methyltransferase